MAIGALTAAGLAGLATLGGVLSARREARPEDLADIRQPAVNLRDNIMKAAIQNAILFPGLTQRQQQVVDSIPQASAPTVAPAIAFGGGRVMPGPTEDEQKPLIKTEFPLSPEGENIGRFEFPLEPPQFEQSTQFPLDEVQPLKLEFPGGIPESERFDPVLRSEGESEREKRISIVKESDFSKDIVNSGELRKNLAKFMKDSKAVDEDGKPKQLFHGTTNRFRKFDIDKTNIENHFGKGVYLTDSPEDASKNYAGEGPDLTRRIELLAERIEQDDNIPFEEAKIKAREKLRGGGDAITPVFASIKNPAIIGGKEDTIINFESEFDEDEEFVEENKNVRIIFDTIHRTADELNFDGERAWAEFAEKMGDNLFEQATIDQIQRALRETEELFSAETDEGELANHQVIQEVFKDLGFDGVIFHNVENEFSNMDIPTDTTHYILFDNKQIKSSIGNKGTFDPNNPDLLSKEVFSKKTVTA